MTHHSTHRHATLEILDMRATRYEHEAETYFGCAMCRAAAGARDRAANLRRLAQEAREFAKRRTAA